MRPTIETIYTPLGDPKAYRLNMTRGSYSFARVVPISEWEANTVDNFVREAQSKLDSMLVKP